MKKLVTTPITNTIWWATVNEEKGTMNTSTRVDVTDNAISAVLDHLRGQNTFKETGFAGYEYDKKSGGTYTIAAYDEKHITISKEIFEELKECKKMYKEIIKIKNDTESNELRYYKTLLESNEQEFNDILGICNSMAGDWIAETNKSKLSALRHWREKIEGIIGIINNQI